MKLLLSGLNMALFTALHTCDISHHVTWNGKFSKWLIKHKEIYSESGFAQYIIYLLMCDSLTQKECVEMKKKGKIFLSVTL